MKSCNENIEKAIALSEAMLELAESGDRKSTRLNSSHYS